MFSPVHFHHVRFRLLFQPVKTFWSLVSVIQIFQPCPPSYGPFQYLIDPIGEHALQVASTTRVDASLSIDTAHAWTPKAFQGAAQIPCLSWRLATTRSSLSPLLL